MVLRIDLKIIIFIMIFYFTNQINIYVIVMFFSIIHELSHLLVGIAFKYKLKQMTVIPVGLSIEFYPKKSKNNKIQALKEFIISIAGPMTNILFVLLFSTIKIDEEIANTIVYSNFLMAFFNILPIYPFDGGRILKSIFSFFVSPKKARIYVNRISNIVLFLISFLFSILIYYFKNVSILIVVIYLWYIVIKENMSFKLKSKLYKHI